MTAGWKTKKSSPLSKVKGDTKEERLKIWYDHLKSLLGPEPLDVDISDDYINRKISNHLPIDTGPFTMKELDKCLSQNLPQAKHLVLTTYLQWYGNILFSKTSFWHSAQSDILLTFSKQDTAICILKMINVCYPKERRFKATIELQRNHFNSNLS